uniref:CSON007359 protein n=1 Tax=Culicoides sonorensis TaxID=179676 RepID=A0A336LMU4_CULSO
MHLVFSSNKMSGKKKRSFSQVDASDEEDFAGFDDIHESDEFNQIHQQYSQNKKIRENSPMKSNKITKDIPKKNYNDPIYRKPFEYNWKRELVYRAIPNEKATQKERGDVYYITPTGKKLRTKQEILNNLDKSTDLTIENFTFAKDPVGGTAEQEIIRHAKIYPNSKRSSDAFIHAQAEAAQLVGKRTPKPKLPKGVSPPPDSKYSAKPSISKESQNGNDQSIDRTSIKVKQKKEQCSIECYKAMGSIPELYCQKCLKLFHHECTDLSKDEIKVYICKGCLNNNDSYSPSYDGNLIHEKSFGFNDNKDAPIQTIAVIAGRKYIVVSRPYSSCAEEKMFHLSKNEFQVISPSQIKHEGISKHKGLTKGIVQIKMEAYGETISSIKSNKKDKGLRITSLKSPFNFTSNFFSNVSVGYDILLHTFQYLKVQELLRCACVCRMWEQVANHLMLWKTVRMKNSMVNDWSGLSNKLNNNKTHSLDLKKMLIASDFEEMWNSFSKNIGKVTNLRSIDFCRCPAKVIEELFNTNPSIETINAVTINSNEIDLKNITKTTNLRELRLRSTDCIDIVSDITFLKELKCLTHLSLTSVTKLAVKDISVLEYLNNLETLELGECTDFPSSFASKILPNLKNLERLRLEKCQQKCSTSHILEAISQLPKLLQLELINFDVQSDFDAKLSNCTNLKRLLLIPTYVSQSATTNRLVLSAILKMSDTLQSFIWTITNELLRVTELYVEEGSKVKCDSIPILKPVPFEDTNTQIAKQNTADISQIEIVPLTTIQNILLKALPGTKIKILKLPLAATWKQSMADF